jgi:NADH:ubiquinone oxidoreductase subunit 4 (subunit M)
LVEESKSNILICLPFLVKLPSYFFHLWLPKAHVEAPTTGRIILAAVLLKLGSFGLFRLSFNFPILVFTLRVIGLVIPPIIALFQRDTKRLVAYSSIGHIALLVLSLWNLTLNSLYRGWLIQIRHGFVSGLLFFIVGSRAHKAGSRLIYYFNYNSFILFFTVCIFNAGGPIRLPFLGEVLFFSSILKERNLIILFLAPIILITTLFNLHLFVSSISKEFKIETETFVFLLWRINLFLLYWSVSLYRTGNL